LTQYPATVLLDCPLDEGRVEGSTEHPRLDASSRGGRRRVRVDRDEDVALWSSERGALLKGQEGISVAREDDIEAGLLQALLQLQSNGQHHVLLHRVPRRGARIMTAMPGVDDDDLTHVRNQCESLRSVVDRWLSDGRDGDSGQSGSEIDVQGGSVVTLHGAES